MIYYKLIQDDKRSKADEVYPIVIRVTFNRISTTVSTGFRVHKNAWDPVKSIVKNKHPNCQAINQQLLELFNKAQKIILRLDDVNEFSFEKFKRALADGEVKKQTKSESFKAFAMKEITALIEINKAGNALVYKTACNRLLDFVSDEDISFKDIDYLLLESFKHQLLKDGVKINTISNYLRTIRAIYNKAIKGKIVDRSYYPFLDVAIKSERTLKRAVSIKDIGKLLAYDLVKESTGFHSRHYFLLSFCIIGMSFTDLAYLKPNNISNNRLIYKRRKTHKEYNIQLNDQAKSIFSLYKGRNSKYLLPILPDSIIEDSLEAKKRIKQFIKTNNKYLRHLGESCNVEQVYNLCCKTYLGNDS
jgi:integrase/recombinase XerD